MDPRAERSKTGSGDSAAAPNALIFCAIKALCLLLGVVGCDKDCDLVRVAGALSDGLAASSSDCDNLVSMDGKRSNTGETRGRDGLVFPSLGRLNDGTRVRNGDTLGTGGKAGSSMGSRCLATIVSPRRRPEAPPAALGYPETSGITVGKYGGTSPSRSLWILRASFGRGGS